VEIAVGTVVVTISSAIARMEEWSASRELVHRL